MDTKVAETDNIEDLEVLTDEALALLSKERDQLVLAKRHGIKDFDMHTLEKIGEELGITRERVRQIEKAALGKIKQKRKHENNLSRLVLTNLDDVGGLLAFDEIADSLNFSKKDKRYFAFLVKLDPRVIIVEKTDQLDPIVVDLKSYTEEDVHRLHDELVGIVKSFDKPVKFANSSKTLTCLDNNWGLKHWPEVNPKNIRDKIYLILRDCGRPMHFRQIAEQIDRLKANPKKVTTQAVHNELIKDSRFVLIGRGIYALREWGYEKGTVADIIEQILEKKER
jgi:hypothetical protein